jgi:hypothetical protein
MRGRIVVHRIKRSGDMPALTHLGEVAEPSTRGAYLISLRTGSSAPRNYSTSEDDVFFCPGMDLLAMRAGHFSALDFCGRPQFFFDRLTARRQFCRRRATDEKAFDDRSFSFRRGRWCKKVHNNKYWLAEPINDARFIDIVR